MRKICSSSNTSCSRALSFFADARSVPNGFSMMIRDRSTSPASAELAYDGQGGLRRHAQVVQPADLPVGLLRELLLGLGDGVGQRLRAVALPHEREPAGEVVPAGLVERPAELVDALPGELDEPLGVEVVQRRADDPAVAEQPRLEQVQQTGEQLAASQVAGGSEQHDHVRLFHGANRRPVRLRCRYPPADPPTRRLWRPLTRPPGDSGAASPHLRQTRRVGAVLAARVAGSAEVDLRRTASARVGQPLIGDKSERAAKATVAPPPPTADLCRTFTCSRHLPDPTAPRLVGMENGVRRRVLVVEDEPTINQAVTDRLRRRGLRRRARRTTGPAAVAAAQDVARRTCSCST